MLTSLLRIVLSVVAFVAAVPVLRSLVGLGTFGDLLAIALPLVVVAGVAAFVVAVWRRTLMAVVVVIATATCAWHVIEPRRPIDSAPPQQPIRVVAANVRFDNGSMSAAVADIIAQDADVVVISELTQQSHQLLSAVYEFEARARSGGQGVYSRIPLQLLPAPVGVGRNTVRVRILSATPFVLYGTHLPRPALISDPSTVTFSNHRRMVHTLADLVDAETEPTVIAGDLNMADRESEHRELMHDRLDTGRVNHWAGATFGRGRWAWLHMRIDYIIVPDTWCAADTGAAPITGSDHRAVAAGIGPCS